MDEISNEELDSQNQPVEETVNTEVVEDSSLEESEDLNALQEKNKKLFERAKKAEAEAKLLKAERTKAEDQVKANPSEKQDGLTPVDLYALIDAKVPQDDIEIVSDYANFKGISVAEAVKSSVMKTELAQRLEMRKTAEVTNTGSGKRTTAKVSDETLLDKARKGEFTDDVEALVEARFNQKIKK